jgi:hypothetical protein
VIEPEPALVPVKVTEHVPADDKLQLLALREPPVAPTVKTKFTLPPGILEAVVVSVTVAVTVATQFGVPNAILQATGPTLVDVLSLATAILLDVPELVLSFESPP